MRKLLLFVFVMISLLYWGSVYAVHDEISRITVEELKRLMDQGEKVVILDVQPKGIYEKGHIKGALSFPWSSNIDEEQTLRLPRDRLVVTYCDCGPGESDSASVAAQLIELGFEHVKVLKDPSVKGWKSAGYPME